MRRLEASLPVSLSCELYLMVIKMMLMMMSDDDDDDRF